MRDLFFYIEAAKKHSGVKSERKLCELLNISHNGIAQYKRGALPNDDTMIKIARVANIEPWQALLDLQDWRTANDPATNSVWKKLAERVTHAALILFMIGTVSLPAAAAEVSHDNTDYVYYGK